MVLALVLLCLVVYLYLNIWVIWVTAKIIVIMGSIRRVVGFGNWSKSWKTIIHTPNFNDLKPNNIRYWPSLKYTWDRHTHRRLHGKNYTFTWICVFMHVRVLCLYKSKCTHTHTLTTVLCMDETPVMLHRTCFRGNEIVSFEVHHLWTSIIISILMTVPEHLVDSTYLSPDSQFCCNHCARFAAW